MTSKRIARRARLLAPVLVVLAAACQATTQADIAGPPATVTAPDAHQQHQPAHARDTTSAAAGMSMSAMDPDTRFMHHMIAHHAQALEMTSLVPPRTASHGLRLLAERITISQKDEIAAMRRWLEQRGRPVPPTDAHGGHAGMPGMLSQADMARLAAASGVEFERLFLELMIRHHEGALTMVAQLLGSQGAAQDSELFRLAADIDADQQAEIARMQSMLRALPARPSR